MARKGLIESNDRKKRLCAASSERRKLLKGIIMNRSLTIEERFEATLKLAQMPRNSAPIRIRSRCFETGRPRGVYRFANLGRIALREKAVRGALPGVRRSSW